jgi:hypothetical protein
VAARTTARATARAAAIAALAALVALPARADDAGALARAAEDLAARVAEGWTARETTALAVSAPGAAGLAAPLETALAGALARRGAAVTPLRRAALADPEGAARALGADRLLRVTAGLVPGRRELVLAAEVIPTRPNFFLQRAREVRPAGSRLVSVSVPADAAVLLLARPDARPPAAPALFVRPLFRIGERVLALAAGDATGDGSTAILVVTPGAASLHAPGGAVVARRELGPPASPVRRPAAAAAVGDFGGGRVAWRLAGAAAGEVAELSAGALRQVASLAAAPLWAGEGGRVFGAFLPGKAALADLALPAIDPDARPRSPREIAAFAGAPHAGRVAFGTVSSDGVLTLLGPDLEPRGRPVPGVGAGLALADLDGDGEPEVVASLAEAGPTDRVRVLRLPERTGGETSTVLESPALPGSILAGAAADLTGDGVDDAVLAAVLPSGESQLWLVTSDPRFREGP